MYLYRLGCVVRVEVDVVGAKAGGAVRPMAPRIHMYRYIYMYIYIYVYIYIYMYL